MTNNIQQLIDRLQKIQKYEFSGNNLIEDFKDAQADLEAGQYGEYEPGTLPWKIADELDGICWDGNPADYDADVDEGTMYTELDKLIRRLKDKV